MAYISCIYISLKSQQLDRYHIIIKTHAHNIKFKSNPSLWRAQCTVSVYIPDRYGDGKMSSCLMKSSCENKTHTHNRIKCCQQGDESCPPPPPPQPCPCTSCPCPPGPLPRTCETGSVSSSLPFCDVTKGVAMRVDDLLSRLTREEKINLVEMV